MKKEKPAEPVGTDLSVNTNNDCSELLNIKLLKTEFIKIVGNVTDLLEDNQGNWVR